MCTTHTLSYLSVSGVCVVKSGQILLLYYNKFRIKCCKIVPVWRFQSTHAPDARPGAQLPHSISRTGKLNTCIENLIKFSDFNRRQCKSWRLSNRLTSRRVNAKINFVHLDLSSEEVCDDPSQVWSERAVSAAPDMAGIPHNYCQYSQTLRPEDRIQTNEHNSKTSRNQFSFFRWGKVKQLRNHQVPCSKECCLLVCLSHRLCPIIGLETCRERWDKKMHNSDQTVGP